MKLLEQTADKGIGNSFEDIGNHVGNFAWVLDGATALLKRDDNPYTPQWLVQEADKVFAKGAETAKSLQELIDFYTTNFPMNQTLESLQRLENPNFAMAIMHVGTDFVEYAVLADCYVSIKQQDSVTVYTNPQWEKLVEDIGKPEFFKTKSEEERFAFYRDIREKSNTPNGYWIGTANGEGLKHLDIQRIPISKDAKFILCTDGFERAVSIFGLANWEELFDANLDKVTRDLRHAETTLLDKTVYPREKISDDVYAIKLSL